MKRKLPLMVKQLEVSLYRSAPSLQAYLDTTTLKMRLQHLSMGIDLLANSSGFRAASVIKEAKTNHHMCTYFKIEKDEMLRGKDLDIARKDKQIEYMKSVVKQQRNQIRQLESILDPADEVDSIRADLKSRSEENDLLKSAITRKDEEIASLKESLKNSKPIDVLDLTDTTSSKRPRTEDTTKSALAFQHEQNQKMVKVKEEKVAVEAALEDVKEDLEDNQEDMGRQVLFTDFLQSKIDELAALAEAGGVDRALVAEIKGRSYSS